MHHVYLKGVDKNHIRHSYDKTLPVNVVCTELETNRIIFISGSFSMIYFKSMTHKNKS